MKVLDIVTNLLEDDYFVPKGPKTILTGAGKVKNPVYDDPDHAWEGNPDEFPHFSNIMKKNYLALKAFLDRHNIKITYMGAVPSRASGWNFIMSGPGIVWYKKIQHGGGFNDVWLNGVRTKLSSLLNAGPDRQDHMLTQRPWEAIKSAGGLPITYIQRMITDNEPAAHIKREVGIKIFSNSLQDYFIVNLVHTESQDYLKYINDWDKFVDKLQKATNSRYSELHSKNLLHTGKPMIVKSLLKSFKKGLLRGTLHKVNVLKNMNFNWPELDTIAASANHEIELRDRQQ